MKFAKGLVFAMESDEVVPGDEVEMVPEIQAEVEAGAAEVTEQAGEIESADVAIDGAQTDAETLGDIQEVMADSVEQGEGMPEEAAAIAEVAVESIRARLGMSASQRALPALESFGSKSSRLQATRIAMESVGETVKKIWENIKKAVAWVWEKIKSFFLSLTKNRAALLKHLEGLKKRVEGLKDEEMNEKTVKGGAAKAFAINGEGSFDIAAVVLGNAGKLLQATRVGAAASEALAHNLTAPTGSVHEINGATESLFTKLEEALSKVGKVSSAKAAAAGTETVHYGTLIGGRSVALSKTKKDDTLTVSLTIEDNSKTIGEAAKTLDKGQMLKLVDLSIEVLKELQAADAAQKSLEKITKACDAVAAAVIKNATSGAGEANKENVESLKLAAANVRTLNGIVAKFGSSVPTAAYQAAKAGGDYVTASLAAHGAKKKEEPKANDKK